MPRHILSEDHIHPAIRDEVANLNLDLVDEVRSAVEHNDTVIVGMSVNPACKRARQTLDARNLPYQYLEYGGYHNEWRRRNALKMWTGWPTFPIVFHKGTLIGGADQLVRLVEAGEIG